MIADQTAGRLEGASKAPTRAPLAPVQVWAARTALVAMGVVGALQLWAVLQHSPGVWHDFAQDHVAIQEALAGRNPYEPQNARIAELFNIPPPRGAAYSFHPPTTLVFFVPLAPLPYRAAFVAWDIVNLLCLWSIVYLTARAIERPLGVLTSGALALGLSAVWPIRENFVEGQINLPVAAGLVAWWYAVLRGRHGLAGTSLGAAVALKPLAGLFLLYVAWRRQWRLLGYAVATLAVFAIAGAALSGLEGVRQYVTTAYPTHAQLWPGFPDNASPQGLFSRLFGPNPWGRPVWPTPGVATALTLASWAVLLALLFLRLGRKTPSPASLNLEFAALGATMLLVTPIIWPHYYVVLLAPLAVLAAQLSQTREWAWLVALAVAVMVLCIPRNDLVPLGNAQLPALLLIYMVAVKQLRPSRIEAGGRGTRFSSPFPSSS